MYEGMNEKQQEAVLAHGIPAFNTCRRAPWKGEGADTPHGVSDRGKGGKPLQYHGDHLHE